MNANARYLRNVLRRPVILLALGLILGMLAGHYTTIRGWDDVAIGTNSVYCGAYLPHLDVHPDSVLESVVYCEHAS